MIKIQQNMPDHAPGHFDLDALKQVAGEKIFARGALYHKEGAVEIISFGKNRVRARILGTHIYEAELSLNSGKISGRCSCPADRDYGFCKHLVAVALSVKDLEPGAQKTTKSRMEKIRDYLHGLDKEALARLVLSHAESDPAILKGLEMGMKAAQGDMVGVIEDGKKVITKATTVRGFVDYDRAPGWARRLEEVLGQIGPLIGTGSSSAALELLDHFFDRMETALENIDDPDGLAGDVCNKAADLYRQACRSLQGDPEDLAGRLFRRETESGWDFFSNVCSDYRDILGKEGLSAYKKLAREAWERLPEVNPNRAQRDTLSTRRYALKSILDSLAEGEDDLDARIALRTKDLSSSGHYLELAKLCFDHGRQDDALKWAEEGLCQFKDDKWPDERLKQFTYDLYLVRGDKTKARDLIWNSFLERPDADKYTAIRDLSKDLAEQAIVFLKEKIAKAGKKTGKNPDFENYVFHKGIVGYMERRDSPAVLLSAILLDEKRLPEAWEVVKDYDAPYDLLEKLARASEKTLPKESVSAYEMLIERYVSKGNTPSYKKAAKLIGFLAGLRGRDEQAAYVSSLSTKYKAKRNFMKLLKPVA